MFSPIVRAPLTWWLPSSWAGEYPSYWSTRALVRASNSARSYAVHQSASRPVPSYLLPWSSNPWPISCPITAPIPP